MSQQQLVKTVVSILTHGGIDYMATGSIVSSIQGEPRLSHDIDLVVALRPSHVKVLLDAFPPPAFYLSEDSIRDALQRKGTFNLLAVDSNDKVDFWMLTDDPFDRSRFARKYPDDFGDMWLQVSSPEDTILAKLRWAKLCGGSEKQMLDALRVYEVQFGKLDMAYITHWAKALDIESLLGELQKRAAPL
jgi:hypothetical protein